jgi:hypothetical protein
MGHTVEDIKIGLDILFNQKINYLDPYVPPLCFRHDLYKSTLKDKLIKVGICKSLVTVPANIITFKSNINGRISFESIRIGNS